MQVKKSTGFNGRVNDIKSGSIQYKIKGKEVDLMHAHNQQGFVVPFSNFSMFTRCVTVVKFSILLHEKKLGYDVYGKLISCAMIMEME